jgi:hypothetical protein
LASINKCDALELSVTDPISADAVPFDDVYEVGFFGRGILYNIGYVIAKSIAENDGSQGLAAYLKQPAYTFVKRYTQLPQYGRDRDHSKLGPNTITAVNQLVRAASEEPMRGRVEHQVCLSGRGQES